MRGLTRIRHAGLVGFVAMLGACATGRGAGAPGDPEPFSRTAAELGLPPCDAATTAAISGPGVPRDWREVSADGFRFCVPADWVGTVPADWKGTGRWWRGHGGWVAWRRMDDGINYVSTTGHRKSAEPWTNSSQVEIGGEVAIVWDRLTPNSRPGRRDPLQSYVFATGAVWRERALLLSGTALTRYAVQLQRRVYRTVRFDCPADSVRRGARGDR